MVIVNKLLCGDEVVKEYRENFNYYSKSVHKDSIDKRPQSLYGQVNDVKYYS